MSPVPPIVHIAAAAAAVFAALTVMPAITPDLPSSEPGVSQPRGLSGPGDPDSLMADGSFSKALADISDQLGGDDVTALDVTPAKITVDTGPSGSGTYPD